MTNATHALYANVSWTSRRAILLASVAIVVLQSPATAQHATWKLDPVESPPIPANYFNGGNWNSGSVPTGIAAFGATNYSDIALAGAGAQVGGWTFTSEASDYYFIVVSTLDFTGPGIVVEGGSLQLDNSGTINFLGSASASAGDGEPVTIRNSGALAFFGSSDGGDARIVNGAGSIVDVSNLEGEGTGIGSIEGAGTVDLGEKTLTVGGNNLSTEFAGAILGEGGVTKVGTGTLTFAGYEAKTYTGTTTIASGTLKAGSDFAFSTDSVHVIEGGATLDLGGFSHRVGGLSGSGQLINSGGYSSTLDILALEDRVFSGDITNMSGMLLQIAGGGTQTLSGDIQIDDGGLSVLDGTLVLSGNNSFSQALVNYEGRLRLESDGAAGGGIILVQLGNSLELGLVSLADGVNNATPIESSGVQSFWAIEVLGTDRAVQSGAITTPTSAVFRKIGTGALTLTGSNSDYWTEVVEGSLYINGPHTNKQSVTDVFAGATLGGSGDIGGRVRVFNGGTLAPGGSAGAAGTLTVGLLELGGGSVLDYQLGRAGEAGGPFNDLIVVNGNVLLDGRLDITESDGGTFGPGLYRLIDFGGTLADYGLVIGAVPDGVDASQLEIQTTSSEVNLINRNGLTFSFWDGVGVDSDGIQGGDGTWQLGGNLNAWTDQHGSINGAYTNGSFAVFMETGGIVTIDNGNGAVTASGLQFAVDGYELGGDDLTLVGDEAVIRVGDGTQAGEGYTATISTGLTGNVGLRKTDRGTLVLFGSASKDYTGTTTIAEGTLKAGSVDALSQNSIHVIEADGTLDLNGYITTIGGLSGSGLLTNTRDGLVTLTLSTYDDLTFSGDIKSETDFLLQKVGSGTQTLSGDISLGKSGLQVLGGTLVVSGNNDVPSIYLDAARLRLESDQAAGGGQIRVRRDLGVISVGGGVNNATKITMAPTDPSLNLRIEVLENEQAEQSGAIQDFHNSFFKIGTGVLTLSGENTYGGATEVAEGTLLVNSTIASSSGVTVASDAVLGGSGTVAGTVVEAGGRLGPGGSVGAVGTLTVAGDLTLAQGSYLDFDFGAPGTSAVPGESDSVLVQGNLVLGGTTLNVSDAGGFGPGVYRLFSYEGSLTEENGGIALGSLPNGVEPASVLIQRLTDDKHIDLVSTAGLTLNFWNANGLASSTQRGGGDGTWSNDAAVWTDEAGQVTAPMQPRPGFAIFAGDAGTVTVDGQSGASPVEATGLQFAADGYRLTGDVLTLVADDDHPAPVEIRVGDGGAGSETWVATIDNEIAGTDGLRKTGAGTLVLSGANSYSGGTYIEAGGLAVSADASLGAGSGALTLNGGVLQVRGDAFTSTGRAIVLDTNGGGFDIASAANTFTLSQVVSGAGSLHKLGAGTLVLTGTNSYAGDTFVAEGTLVGTAASIRGHIGNAGTVIFDQAADATFGGNIAGTGDGNGTMIKQGAGELTLAGTSSLDWSVNEGSLVSSAERFGGDIAIAAMASFAFDQDVDAIYAGSLSGEGSFIKRGSARLVYDGDGSAFTGTTTVSTGALIVGSDADHGDAVLGGQIDVLAGALLGGRGTVGSITLAAGAVIAPGNSIDTLNVVGDITFDAGSTYLVEVDPEGSESDLIHATGMAYLNDASVLHIGADGTYNPISTYTILTADAGIDGTFGTVTSNFAFLDATLTYDANNVYLQLGRNDIDFCLAGMTANQCATGSGVQSIGFGNPLYDAVLGLSGDQAADAFNQLSGEVHASARTAMIEDSRFLRDAMSSRLGAAFGDATIDATPVLAYGDEGLELSSPSTDAFVLWGQGFGSWGHRDSDGNAARFDRDTGGFIAGADAFLADWRIGVMAGYSRTGFAASDRFSSGSADNWHLGVYGGTEWGNLGFRSGLAYSWHDIDTNRSVAFPGFAETLSGSYQSGTLQAFGELGYRIDTSSQTVFEPFVNLAHVSHRAGAFTETGGTAALSALDQTLDATFTTLGLRASHELTIGMVDVTARGMVGWQHAFGDTTPTLTQAFAGSDTFTIAGIPIAPDAALVEAGLDFSLSPDATLNLSYQAQFAAGTMNQAVSATLNVSF